MMRFYLEKLQEDYYDVNRRINLNMESQEILGKEIDRFIVANGYQSPELDEQFQELCDAMNILLEERYEISRKMKESEDMDPSDIDLE